MNESSKTVELLHYNINLLIPQTIFDIAKNPDNIDAVSIKQNDGWLSFLIVERNHHETISNQEWLEWWANVNMALKQKKSPPKPPQNIGPLHRRFRKEIDNGLISLSDKIYLACSVKINVGKINSLYVCNYDGEKDRGIATQFYTQVLPKLAGNLGLRYLAGYVSKSVLPFFTNKLGRYTCQQLLPEERTSFFPKAEFDGYENELLTVQFLHPEDVEKFVIPEEIKR
jgi:hypothetical protein